eukprot:jgi/Hompol1/5146/HPOL_001892-RA
MYKTSAQSTSGEQNELNDDDSKDIQPAASDLDAEFHDKLHLLVSHVAAQVEDPSSELRLSKASLTDHDIKPTDDRPHTTGSIGNLAQEYHQGSGFELRAATDSEFDVKLDSDGAAEDHIDEVEIAEAAYLRALMLKQETDYEWVRSKLHDERQAQKEIRFKIEQLRASKTSSVRTIRDGRSKLLSLHDKIRIVTQWLTTDSRVFYEREHDRSTALIQRAHALKRQMMDWTKKQRHELEIATMKRDAAEAIYMQTRSEAAEVRIKGFEMEEAIKNFNADIDNIQWEVIEKRKLKDQCIEARIRREAIARQRELELLKTALERRRNMGNGQFTQFEELDVIDLSTLGLAKLPKSITENKRARYLQIDQNGLKGASEIYDMTELISLSANENKFEKLDFVHLARLRFLSLARNHIKDLTGLGEALTFLDLTDNPLTNIDALASTTSLQILVLQNAFEYLRDSPILMYMSISNNLVYTLPDIHNHLLYELDLSANLLTGLNLTSWLCRLKILNLKDNQISDIQPLSMCPFLRVLNLENNKLNDIKNIYSIAVCQELQSLDLSENLIETNLALYRTVGTLFPQLQYSKDPSVRLQMQERRLQWISNMLSNMYRSFEALLMPSFDTSIIPVVRRLKDTVYEQRVVFVQSIWRMHTLRRDMINMTQMHLEEDPTQWIGNTNVNAFDDHINDYLATENLVHFESDAKAPSRDAKTPNDHRVGHLPFDSASKDRQLHSSKTNKFNTKSSQLSIQREELIKKISLQLELGVQYAFSEAEKRFSAQDTGKEAYSIAASESDSMKIAKELGWTAYNSTTMALYDKKYKQAHQPELHEHKREPLPELPRDHPSPGLRANAGLDRKRLAEQHKISDLSRKPKTLDTPVIYEWDLHTGETRNKITRVSDSMATQTLSKYPPSQPTAFSVVGPGAQPFTMQPKETKASHTPKVTLLINNYVVEKMLEGPQTTLPIQKWQKSPANSSTSSIDAYHSRFKPRHPPLPAIAQPAEMLGALAKHGDRSRSQQK